MIFMVINSTILVNTHVSIFVQQISDQFLWDILLISYVLDNLYFTDEKPDLRFI